VNEGEYDGMMDAFCIHIQKQNNEICQNCSKKVGRERRENNRGDNLTKIYCKHM
jgi:hypothetical protein